MILTVNWWLVNSPFSVQIYMKISIDSNVKFPGHALKISIDVHVTKISNMSIVEIFFFLTSLRRDFTLKYFVVLKLKIKTKN